MTAFREIRAVGAHVAAHSQVFRGLRLELLLELAKGPAGVSTLARRLGRSIGNVSQELRVLKNEALVDYRSCKKEHLYSLTHRVRIDRKPPGCIAIRFPDGCEALVRLSGGRPDTMPEGPHRVDRSLPTNRKGR